MLGENKLYEFLAATKDDGRISAVHIALYLALIQKSLAFENNKEIKVSRQEIMCLAKISSRQTYNKRIRELQEFGYIKYYPSFHQTAGAIIHLT
jgi:hypothetical protein